MSDWTEADLLHWDEKIIRVAEDLGLDWHPIDYEIIDYQEMLGAMAYVGLPTHYRHWSYGKEYERTHTLYNMGQTGLPYEMIINSNPSIAYLMRENALYIHLLTMAHCVGHSDFFKQNRMFAETNPENVIDSFKSAAKYVRKLIEDPSIGIDRVEAILDAAHSIKYQVPRFPGIKYKTHQELLDLEKKQMNEKVSYSPDLSKVPLRPEYNLLRFIAEHSNGLEDWERNLILIVEESSKYFIPQALTKVMNEGWACTIHYKIINELNLPDNLHLPFIKLHNQVVRPHLGQLNPYHLGFKLFERIIEEGGFEEAMIVREVHNDISFLRFYCDQAFMEDMNYFSYSFKKDKKAITIDDIADASGWEGVRDEMIKNVGLNRVPVIYVEEIEKDNTLCLTHEHDGRDLDLTYARKVFESIQSLWKDNVKLITIVENEIWEF
jgi:stage V sporulation protein R|tara:strand:+ start:3216 stop:4523 length:1308 start_codon:yes stop_codon:yes gene_type:complete